MCFLCNGSLTWKLVIASEASKHKLVYRIICKLANLTSQCSHRLFSYYVYQNKSYPILSLQIQVHSQHGSLKGSQIFPNSCTREKFCLFCYNSHGYPPSYEYQDISTDTEFWLLSFLCFVAKFTTQLIQVATLHSSDTPHNNPVPSSVKAMNFPSSLV